MVPDRSAPKRSKLRRRSEEGEDSGKSFVGLIKLSPELSVKISSSFRKEKKLLNRQACGGYMNVS